MRSLHSIRKRTGLALGVLSSRALAIPPKSKLLPQNWCDLRLM
jgi:hypothetical protein